MESGPQLTLRFGLSFEDLYRRDGLVRLDAAFLDHLAGADPTLRDRLDSARRDPASLASKAESELIVELAPHLEDFIGELFGIETELAALQARHSELAPLRTAKRKFVMRRLVGKTAEQAAAIDGLAVATELEAYLMAPLTELTYATHVARWMEAEAEHAEALRLAADYATWAVLTPEGQEKHRHGVVFKLPKKVDVYQLVPHVTLQVHGTDQFEGHKGHLRQRQGFHLTDPGTDLAGALDQAGYCIKCHHQGKDSCSHGLREKDGSFKKSVFGVPLAGCPLEEKISEMNELKEARATRSAPWPSSPSTTRCAPAPATGSATTA